MKRNETLKWEELSPNYGVYVNSHHHFTTDTLLLAAFSQPKKGEIGADFGTGCGTIPILWQRVIPPKQSYAIEIQPEAARLAELSIEKNGLQKSVKVLCKDIREYRMFLPHQGFDKIACNPPYKAKDAGLKNEEEALRIARHEDSLTAEDIAKAAVYSLKFGGGICICQRPERLTDYMTIFRAHHLEPKRLQIVQQNKKSAPSLFLLEARRGGKPGLNILPTLMVEAWRGYTVKQL